MNKQQRIKMLEKIIMDLKDMQDEYKKGYPSCTLIEAGMGHIVSLHCLEESNFDEETLG
jgi:hypothetical protein